MSNPIKLHKRPSIKTQGTMRVTENGTHVKTTIPHLPKINSADIKENDVKQSQIPISHIANYFMERKKTLKLDGFRWEMENISMPSNLPLVIRSFGSGNGDNVMHKEKHTENRKGGKSCVLESSKTRKNPQNSSEGSTNTNSVNTGLGDGGDRGSSSLRQYNGPLTAKFQNARINVAAKFQGGHQHPVDGGNASAKSVNSAKIAKSSSDPVARMKWTKGVVNRQHRPSAMSFAEKGNTRTELEQHSSPSCSIGISLDLKLDHRCVSRSVNCSAHAGSDTLCFDDDYAHDVENITGEKGADPDHAPEVASITTFLSPDIHNSCAMIPNREKAIGKLKKTMKHPKLQQTKSNSTTATSLSKVSAKPYFSKASEKTACCPAISKWSDKGSKVSCSMSEDGRSEEYTFAYDQIRQEKGASISADDGEPLMKCGMRSNNQKRPLRSSLKKSFDWWAHSQTTTVHVPKIGEQCKDAGVNRASDRSTQGCLRNKLAPLYRSLNQTSLNYMCSIPKQSTEFCAKFCYDQKQYRKLRQFCYQPHHRSACNVELQTVIRQRFKQLHYYGTMDQRFTRNIEMAASTKMSSDQFYCRENCTSQPEDEPQNLQFPQLGDSIWSRNSSAERIVELFNSHGEVPKIIMTCPTPIPCRIPS